LLEADFQREYNINLIKDFRAMSLRRFLALFYCLSKNSLLVDKEAYLKSQEEDTEDLQEASFDEIDWR